MRADSTAGGARRPDGLSILLLCDDSPRHAPNVLEHIRAFQRWSRHSVDLFNPRRLGRSHLLRFDDYDVVVIHYTIFVLSDSHLGPWFRDKVASFTGLKVQFIQDEYRWVDAITTRMRELGISLLFSSVPPEAVPLVYGRRLPGVDIVPTLTGYVPAELEDRRREPLHDRSLDVVYRGRSVPYWLGRLGQDKVRIGREFLERAASTELRCDISSSEADRIYGEAWYRFLGSSRTTLGTESGASIVDFDGSLHRRTETYLRARPAATFEEVEREILATFEGNATIRAISPRVFEAAALGTAMVNFTGRYSDVIEPWNHYIPLEQNFANFDEVVAAIRDDAVLDRIASRAHEDLVLSGRYSLRRFVEDFEREIEARVQPTARPGGASRVVRTAKRPLLALDQLRSPSQLAELPLLASLRPRANERAGRRLIRRFPEIELLARRTEQTHSPEKSDRVEHDLVRLAAAAAAHLRELRYLGPPFDVRLELDDESRRLMLIGSREPAQDVSELDRLRNRVEVAVRDGRLEEIVWDNSAAEGFLKFVSIPVASLEIGYHVIGGAHRFTALEELARDDADGFAAALEPLFRRRPDTPVHEFDRRTRMLLQAALSPGKAVALGKATLGPGAPKELRRLLRAYLVSAKGRADVPVGPVFRDAVLLQLVAESPTSLELEAGRTKLVYRTDPNGTQDGLSIDVATVRALQTIVWDDSAAGSSTDSKQSPRLSVAIAAGVHELDALTLVARRFPELALPALRWAAGAE